MRYSFIIPVYNRPDEVDELLQSLLEQTFRDFEVIVVEDGSSVPCRDVTLKYADRLDLHYYTKPNSGPTLKNKISANREHYRLCNSERSVSIGNQRDYRGQFSD